MKQRAKTVFKYLSLLLLVAECVLLIAEALLPGETSSEHSEAVGGFVDEIFTDLAGSDSGYDVPAEEIKIAERDFSLVLGEKKQLEALPTPQNASASHLKLNWTCDDKNVVTVRGGVAVAKGIGTAHITVSLEENPAISDTVEVCVLEVFAESLTLQLADGATVPVGGAEVLHAVLTPKRATGTITYSSDNAEVATVGKDGTVRGVSAGTATITAEYTSFSERDGERVTLTAGVVVTVEDVPFVPASSIRILSDDLLYDGESCYLFADMGATFSAELAPSGANEEGVVWSSSDEEVLKIDALGRAVPQKKGRATVTARAAASGVSSTLEVEVRNRELGVKITTSKPLAADGQGEYFLTLTVGKRVPLTVEGTPSELFVRYETESNAVEIDDGMLLPYSVGEARVRVIVSDNEDFSAESGLCEAFTLRLEIKRAAFSDSFSGWKRFIRKLFGHFGAFLVLGVLTGLVAIFFERKDLKWRLIALLLGLVCGFAFAGLTELLQLGIFTAGRGASIYDVLIDFGGFAPALLVVYGGYLIISAIIKKVKR